MLYTQRREFVYDPELNAVADTNIALRLFDEYCKRYGSRPAPRFLEVDRSPASVDPLWHMPTGTRTTYSRQLDIYAINQFQKPDWRLTKVGITYQRRDMFWLSNLALQAFDYFPLRGDVVSWNGYRYIIIGVTLPPDAYWGQTGVWTGLTVDCVVPATGDATPAGPLDAIQPAERSINPTAG